MPISKNGTRVTVVETGAANLASVCAGFERVGAQTTLSRDPRIIASAQRVVLPGVGTFAAGMAALRGAGLESVLRERIAAERPTFGICLGLQLLATESEESELVEGLGVFSQRIERLRAPTVPHMGWNQVSATGDFLRDGWAYFANSYALTTTPAGWSAAWTDYGGQFVAAVERGPIVACQFHPEISGDWGLELLQRWMEGTSC